MTRWTPARSGHAFEQNHGAAAWLSKLTRTSPPVPTGSELGSEGLVEHWDVVDRLARALQRDLSGHYQDIADLTR